MRRSVLVVFASIIAAGTVAFSASPAAACEPASPWNAEVASGDHPACLSISSTIHTYSDVLAASNECAEAVTLETVECDGVECDLESEAVEVPAGETVSVSPEMMGFNEEKFDDGQEATVTLAWTRGSSEEGVVEADVRYEDTSGACDGIGGGGCGCSTHGEPGIPPVGAAALALIAGLAIRRTWRIAKT